MAKATKEYKVTLEMEKEEAEVLHSILQHIGGHVSGPRGVLAGINIALSNVGVGYAALHVSGSSGCLYIEEPKK